MPRVPLPARIETLLVRFGPLAMSLFSVLAAVLAIAASMARGASPWFGLFIGAVAGVAVALLLASAAERRRTRTLASLGTAIIAAAQNSDLVPLRAHRDGHLRDIVRIVETVFARAAAERTELTRDRARLSAVLASMVEGVLVVNVKGAVELVNGAAQQMLRLQASAVGRQYVEVIRHPDIAAQIADALEGTHPAGVELSVARDPERVLVSRAAPVEGTGGTGALLVLHDITDLRRADRIRRDFVANVSHELRTPLTAIRGYVEALVDGPDDPGDRERFLGIIARHSGRMETLVKDLLRLARLDAGQEVLDLTPCATDALFNGVVTELRPTLAARAQRVLIHIAPDAVTVTGDSAKLHDIIRNLAENASNYSPEDSTITLDAWREHDRIVLRVSDEGPGIPDADLQRVFERFYRVDKARSRETGGTGLGLSIVKHLVELHRGDVEAVNDDRGGAHFIVRLPATQ